MKTMPVKKNADAILYCETMTCLVGKETNGTKNIWIWLVIVARLVGDERGTKSIS